MTYGKTILALLTAAVVSQAQTPYNTLFHGLILPGGEASSMATGGSGLLPAHNGRISHLNPSTWPDLRYAFLTAHYGAGRIDHPDSGFRSQFGRLENVSFIVPIRNEYALGLGLKPFSRKNFSVEEGERSIILFSSDTLLTWKAIEGDGGISSLYAGGSWKMSDTTSLGARIDFLFGVFRETTSSYLEGKAPVIAGRDFQYKGTLFSFYYRTVPGNLLPKAALYLAAQIALGEGDVVLTHHPLYLDRSGDGTHSSSDRPFPTDVTESVTRLSLHLPSTVSAGVAYRMADHTYLNVEGSATVFSDKPETELSSVETGYRARTGSSLGLGLLRERIPGSRDFINLFHYRVGLFQRQHYIFGLNGSLKEQGVSAGIGIPFGSKSNQVDIGFRLSKRDGFLSNSGEYVGKFSLGITIGDAWLVKRRRR